MFSPARHTKLAFVILSALLATEAVHGEDAKYEMVAYVDAPGGRELLAGHYADAVSALDSARPRSIEEKLMHATNLCVAYTAMENAAPAQAACNDAVRYARDVDAVPGTLIRFGSETAKALSNLQVLNARSRRLETFERIAQVSQVRQGDAADAAATGLDQ